LSVLLHYLFCTTVNLSGAILRVRIRLCQSFSFRRMWRAR
jgi:hypothetical protein